MISFIYRQISQVRRGGYSVLARKIKTVIPFLARVPIYVCAVPVVLVIRLIKPWVLLRFAALDCARIGHFTAKTELHLCERDAGINRPTQRYVDIYYFATAPLCNYQLAKMWKRIIPVWPAWVAVPIVQANRLIPRWEVHHVQGLTNARDNENFYDRTQPHLSFTDEEVARGDKELSAMGIPVGAPFICLIVRDSAYLDSHLKGDYSYHQYRDSDIDDYLLAAEELAKRGYFVIRMGFKVNKALNSQHEKVIDYATNGMRSDFMDIYLGAKCTFCISTGTGWDGVPEIFRRPTVFVNFVPLGLLLTFRRDVICITKHHHSKTDKRELNLKEIFIRGTGFCTQADQYDKQGVQLIDNSPEEIRDVAIEMSERLNDTWQPNADDDALQQRFFELFVSDTQDGKHGRPLHGRIHSRFGASFLRNNRWWVQ